MVENFDKVKVEELHKRYEATANAEGRTSSKRSDHVDEIEFNFATESSLGEDQLPAETISARPIRGSYGVHGK